MVHWVMSAEFDVSFARGLLCCNLFSPLTERSVAYGLLFGCKICRDGCRLGFVHRGKFSPRVPVYSYVSQVSICILLYVSANIYVVGNFADFLLQLF